MKFVETENLRGLVEFYKANGLEVSDCPETEDGAVFSVAAEQDGKILAAATLSFRFGIYILDYIAVDNSLRRAGAGTEALRLIVKKAKSLGADKLYLTAKNPEFFKSAGFSEGSPDGVDMNADCVGCPQLGNGCVKLPMYLELI